MNSTTSSYSTPGFGIMHQVQLWATPDMFYTPTQGGAPPLTGGILGEQGENLGGEGGGEFLLDEGA